MNLPQDFISKKTLESEDDLLMNLIQDPLELKQFLVAAINDMDWLRSHEKFIRKIFVWLTDSHMAGTYPKDFFYPFIQFIHKHYDSVKELIPLDLYISNKNINTSINSLLLGLDSFYFQRAFSNICRYQKKRELEIENIDYYQFKLIEEAVSKGAIENLWREEPKFLWDFVSVCKQMDLHHVVVLSEDVLKRYITRENALKILLRAHLQGLELLKNGCIDFLNKENLGVILEKLSVQYLGLDFEDFKERALSVYETLREEITHLGFTLSLMEESPFLEVIEKAPKLFALNLSDTISFSEKLKDLPAKLRQITLNRCKWLDNTTLDLLSRACPEVTILDLSSNDHLNYAIWGELNKFKKLQRLNISRCYLINDDELKMILASVGDITELQVDNCKRLSPHIFFELPKFLPHLEILNVARTSINDAALIDILTNCRELSSIDLSRCDNISEKGLLTAVKNNLTLKKIVLRGVNLSLDSLEQIRKLRPYLIIDVNFP